MKVRVKFFASHREAAGKAQEEVQIEVGATVKDLADMLVEKYPEMGGSLRRNCIYSLNQKIVDEEAKLNEGDVVSIFPPVGGG